MGGGGGEDKPKQKKTKTIKFTTFVIHLRTTMCIPKIGIDFSLGLTCLGPKFKVEEQQEKVQN